MSTFATTTSEHEIEADDLCPICQLLLYDPVTTTCRHTLCRSCMARWADVSLSEPIAVLPVNDEPFALDSATGLEARCPMCRTYTTASEDRQRAAFLRRTYRQAYAQRRREETAELTEALSSVQIITIEIGNEHELVTPRSEGGANQHQWTFFVRPSPSSRVNIMEEVQIFLHPTFRPSHIIRTLPPYEIRRLLVPPILRPNFREWYADICLSSGWGCFTVTAAIILKAGYSWVSSDAEDSPDGAAKGMLRLEWMLDFVGFGGAGSKRRYRLKVHADHDAWENVSDEEDRRDRAEWNRTVRSYQRDERWEPDDDEE